MSTFKVAVETIARVIHHPNADKLDLAELEGMSFQFVVLRDQYKPGDRVVYLPVDALVPAAVTDQIGLTGKLGGKNKDRVKTIRLRGEISQGVVGPLTLLDPVAPTEKVPGTDDLVRMYYHNSDGESLDFAPQLGITKYEPPQPGEPCIPGAARERTLPEGVTHYDIEGCDRYKAQLEQMLDWPMFVMEKLEGSHTAITRYPDGRIVVASRNHALKPPEDFNTCRWHKGCQNSDLFRKIQDIANQWNGAEGKQVTLRGELLGPGVQENIYRLTDYKVVVFEVEIDGVPLSGDAFLRMAWCASLEVAPVLNAGESRPHMEPKPAPTLREWLAGRTPKEASTGPAHYRADHLREGIVLRPWLPEHAGVHLRGVGRAILKYRSPEYLEKTGL